VLLDNNIVNVAVIENKIEDSGRIEGLSSEDEAVDLSRYLRRVRCGGRSVPGGAIHRAFTRRRFHPRGSHGGYRRAAGRNRGHARLL